MGSSLQDSQTLKQIESMLAESLKRAAEKQNDIELNVQVANKREIDPDDEDNESEDDRQTLVREMQHRKATNQAFQVLAKEALSKLVSQRTGQEVGDIEVAEDGTVFGNIGKAPPAESSAVIEQRVGKVKVGGRGFAVGNVAGDVDFAAVAQARSGGRG